MMVNRNCCLLCGKEKATYKCEGCMNSYCKNHLQDHQKELELQLDEIENERNILRQTFLEQQQQQPNQRLLIEQIDDWKRKSIKKIEQTAEEIREFILAETNKHFRKVEVNLERLTDEIKEIRQENDFNELNLNDFKAKLEELQRQLNSPTNISLKEENSSSFINKIYVDIAETLKWKQNAITIAGGNGQGNELNQLSRPWSIYIDDDKTIYVVDMFNHRIVAWKQDTLYGEIITSQNQRLNFPSKIILDKINDCFIIADYANERVVRWSRRACEETIIRGVKCVDVLLYNSEYLYVSDEDKHEVRRWKIGENQGVLVAGGNGSGNHLNQFHKPHFIFLDQDETLYVSDLRNHRVMKWTKGAKEGIVVAGGQGQGSSLKQLSYPQGIFVDRIGNLYVADSLNDRIVRWTKDANEGSIIVGGGNQSNKLSNPIGLSFDTENNLYVVDHDNHRIQKFLVDDFIN